MVGVVIGVNKVKGTVDISVKPSYLRVNESWWIANRSTDKNASKWYSEQGKVPGELYDRYFLEREALEELARVEAPITNGGTCLSYLHTHFDCKFICNYMTNYVFTCLSLLVSLCVCVIVCLFIYLCVVL